MNDAVNPYRQTPQVPNDVHPVPQPPQVPSDAHPVPLPPQAPNAATQHTAPTAPASADVAAANPAPVAANSSNTSTVHTDTVVLDQVVPEPAPQPSTGTYTIPPTPPMLVRNRAKRSFSAGMVGAMVLATALVSGATSAIVMDARNDSGYTSSNTSLTRTSNSGEVTPVAEGSIEAVAQAVLPSVVSIQVASGLSGSSGSGSIISPDGLIITNHHVISGASNGNIQVLTNDGRTFDATLVASDPRWDIAVIKAEGASDLQPMAIGDSDAVNVGEQVIAVGSPLGYTSTVTRGIVSAKNRPVQASGENGGEASLIDAIQTDAAINPGNSGGALVNMQGELIGIPTVIATMGGTTSSGGSIGLGFAIPSNNASKVAGQLIDTGQVRNPIVGAQVNTASTAAGAEIAAVNPGSPAEAAGLTAGDVVLRVNDRPVESGVALIAAIRSHNVGDTITLLVRGRGGEERTVEVTLASE